MTVTLFLQGECDEFPDKNYLGSKLIIGTRVIRQFHLSPLSSFGLFCGQQIIVPSVSTDRKSIFIIERTDHPTQNGHNLKKTFNTLIKTFMAF